MVNGKWRIVVEQLRRRTLSLDAVGSRPPFTIYHSLFTLQKSFRRVHAYELGVGVYLDADALGECDEVFAFALVAYDEHVGLAARVQDLSHSAELSSLDRLGAAAFELPVVELALFELDRLRLGDCQLTARERGRILGRVV